MAITTNPCGDQVSSKNPCGDQVFETTVIIPDRPPNLPLRWLDTIEPDQRWGLEYVPDQYSRATGVYSRLQWRIIFYDADLYTEFALKWL